MSCMFQPGIVHEVHPAARFLVLSIVDLEACAEVLRGASQLVSEVLALDPSAELVCTVAFSAEVMERLECGRPRELTAFETLSAGDRIMPSTQADAFVHISSRRPDLCFELGRRLRAGLGAAAHVVEEVPGFRYLDQRDLTGFIDGTENPALEERAGVAVVGAEDAAFAGGSYVLVQRYVHHLARWGELSQQDQERAIGRTKPDSVERDDKPATAHISRVVIEEDGEELEIVRHSMPYGSTDEHGLVFVAYCRTPSTFTKMLRRMVGMGDDGLRDRLLDFVTPATGHFFFAPSMAQLASLRVRA